MTTAATTTPIAGSVTFRVPSSANLPGCSLKEEFPLSKEEKLMAAATEATGDDNITDVAVLQPKGTAAATGAGAAAGSLAGGGATGSNWGSAFGATGGAAAGKALMGIGKDLPPRICVAISPSEVYLFGMKTHGTSLDPLARSTATS
jgi:hypothetical protein